MTGAHAQAPSGLTLGAQIMEWADALADITEVPGTLTRTFLTPQHRIAGEKVVRWMRAAGMTAAFDGIGNVAGRREGYEPRLPALMIGSHLDTVRDAGRYDGMLGVLTAVACVGALGDDAARLPFAIEIVGFGDEEGVRFQSTLLGSRAVAGSFDGALLDARDDAGITLAEAMRQFGLDPARVSNVRRERDQILAYVELHIEQGPVLDSLDMPLGVVTSISGATRHAVEILGEAGHAGTVPMRLRRDALAAAAQAIIAVERRCGGKEGLVGTVGRIEVEPGTVNVVPGSTRFTLDIRAAEDADRQAAVADVLAQIEEICNLRGLSCRVTATHDHRSTACAPWLMTQIEEAIAAQGLTPISLPSGAGHDAMALADLTDIGMIFVRCARGISHNPQEAVTIQDVELGARALLHFIRHFRPKPPAASVSQ